MHALLSLAGHYKQFCRLIGDTTLRLSEHTHVLRNYMASRRMCINVFLLDSTDRIAIRLTR